MKTPILCALLLVSLPLHAAPASKKKDAISITSINTSGVMGRLGVPLGTVVQIDATVVSGDSLRLKAYSGTYLLKVTAIKGALLEEPVILRFSHTPGSNRSLASSTICNICNMNPAVLSEPSLPMYRLPWLCRMAEKSRWG